MDDVDISNLEANPNIIYITEEEHRSEWSYEATKEFLKIYDEKTDMLDTGIITTQKKLWELTAKALAKKGFHYTGAQCENKWKALKRSYRAKLERMQKYGSCKRSYPFESEVAEILSKRPNSSITRSYSLKINELIKKEEDLYKVNLNEPPGFIKDDESNLLQDHYKIMQDHKNAQILENMESAYQEEVLSETSEPSYAVAQEANQALIVEELADMKNIMSKHYKVNTLMLKQSTAVEVKMLKCLNQAVETQKKAVEMEEKKIAQQNQVIQQMKIQNSLLHKLLEKLG